MNVVIVMKLLIDLADLVVFKSFVVVFWCFYFQLIWLHWDWEHLRACISIVASYEVLIIIIFIDPDS